MAPVERGWISFFVDRLAGWYFGLAGETCSYTVQHVRIPIGTANLAANLYQPKVPKPKGTIMVRTSYGISPLMAISNARVFAARGYVVLLAACRGTDPSDGQELALALHEGPDGLATVAWMREQPWYTGSFATIGGSYLGYTQWAILSNPPPDMKAAVVMTGPVDFGDFAWHTGALESHFIAWADLMTLAKRNVKGGLGYVKKQADVLRPVYDSVPLMEGIEKHLGKETPDWLRTFVTDPGRSDPLFKTINHDAALQRASIPILQFTGWTDTLLPCVTEQHEILAERKAPTFITIGPWSHLGAQRGPAIVEGLKFIDTYLGGQGEGFRTQPVRAFVTGKKQWQELSSWPPVAVSTRELYFGVNKTLLSQQQSSEADSSSCFRFDPANPTPKIGLPRPFDGRAPTSYDDTALATRDDAVVFTSEPLEADLEVAGRAAVEMTHSSGDNPHVDVLVRLSEVDSRGRSTRVSEVYRRLDPARGSEPLRLTLSDCGHVFRRGARIRVAVAGGAHPAYIRNLGTGENPGTGSSTRPAVHTVHHSRERPSKLILPVTTLTH